MAYTFGASAADDLTFSMGIAAGASTNQHLVAGWWKPTTLTATRGLWSFGNNWGCEIDTTTSELRLRSDNTTDGQWTTTGVNFTLNEWKFLAFFGTQNNTGPVVSWNVWAGDIATPPQLVTVTQATAPVGNAVSNASFYLGNKGTSASLAFQGLIGNAMVYSSSGSIASNNSPFGLSSTSSISAEATDVTYRRFVEPLWLGNGLAALSVISANALLTGTADRVSFITMDLLPQVFVYNRNSATMAAGLVPTINGATYSQEREPRPIMINPLHAQTRSGD